MNCWGYIYELLGPGLHWFKPQELFLTAIARAEREGQHEAAHHIRIILKMRNDVMMEKQKEAPPERG